MLIKIKFLKKNLRITKSRLDINVNKINSHLKTGVQSTKKEYKIFEEHFEIGSIARTCKRIALNKIHIIINKIYIIF